MSTIIFVDGGCRGNPGPSSAGVYIPSMGFKLGFPLEDTTNNVAEYKALIHALRVANQAVSGQLEIKSDSQLMVRQMTGAYAVRSEHILPLWELATEWAAYRGTEVLFTHVRREDNAVADRICNLTLDAMALGYKGPGIRWGDLDKPGTRMEQLLEEATLS
jgi:ribonuclease HI